MSTNVFQPSVANVPDLSERRRAGVIHIIVSVMYLVDIVLHFTQCSNVGLNTVIILGSNTFIALATGIIGLRASMKLANIRIVNVYILLSIFSILAACLLVLLVVISLFNSSCDRSELLFKIIFDAYSITSALIGICNSVVSVYMFGFRKRIERLLTQKNLIDNSAMTEQNHPTIHSTDNIEYSTVNDMELDNVTSSENIKPTPHMYERKIYQSQFQCDKDYPIDVINNQEESLVEVRRTTTTRVECHDTSYVYDYAHTPPQPNRVECHDRPTSYAYDYAYMQPPTLPRPASTNQTRSPNTYLELIN